jgi:group I intron endonuclease
MGNPQPSSNLIKIVRFIIKMGVIYCITFPSGKRYIGQTIRNPQKRFKEHCKCIGSCILLENAIKKYGVDTLQFEVLVKIDRKHLDEYENKFITLFQTIEPHGYNIRSGGSTGIHSEASKQRMREQKLGDKNHNFGKPRSDETKKAISDAKSGEKHHFYQQQLSIEHKLALSKAHKNTHAELPMYVVYVKERPVHYCSNGYAIVNHPILKNKYFTSKYLTESDKLNKALEYLNQHECSSETKW